MSVKDGFSCKGKYQSSKVHRIKKLCEAIPPSERGNLRTLILAKARLLGEEVDEQSLRLVLKHLGKEE